MPPLTLPIPQDLADRLAVLASETGRPVSFHFQEAVRAYLDEMEDEMEDAALAAIQYGQVSGAVYAACGVILSLLPCKKAGVTVDLDYGSRETTALFSARASILPLFLLGEAWHLFWNGLPLLRKLQAAGNIPPRGKKG